MLFRSTAAKLGDAFHLHSYRMSRGESGNFRLLMDSRMSTDVSGIATCLGLQAEARVELAQIIAALQAKISSATLFQPTL